MPDPMASETLPGRAGAAAAIVADSPPGSGRLARSSRTRRGGASQNRPWLNGTLTAGALQGPSMTEWDAHSGALSKNPSMAEWDAHSGRSPKPVHG